MLGTRPSKNRSVNVRIAVAAACIRRRVFLNRAAWVVSRNDRRIRHPPKTIRGLALRRLLLWSNSKSSVASKLVLLARCSVSLVVFRSLYGRCDAQ